MGTYIKSKLYRWHFKHLLTSPNISINTISHMYDNMFMGY